MRAVVWHRNRKVSIDEVPDPKIEEPTDAVVRITHTGICGSDLHLYAHGASMAMKPGDIVGHEPLGVVEEVGSEVTHVRPGDRVVVPFNISCGSCFMCERGLHSQCETTQNLGGRKGASLFGYTHLYGGVPGAQAEYLRVPQAHFGPLPVPGGVADEAAVLLSDVLPTAWQAVAYADVPPEGTVAVYGVGPIGQMCVRIAFHLGAGRVIALDREPDRLALAAKYGAEPVDVRAADDPVDAVRALTGGRGADSVVDAVGLDAHGTLTKALQLLKVTPDRLDVLHHSLSSARRGGTVSVIGVYVGWMPFFPLGDLFDRQVTLRWGQANVRRWTDDLVRTLSDGDPLDSAGLVDVVASLDEAPAWYEAFEKKEPGVTKVVLRP